MQYKITVLPQNRTVTAEQGDLLYFVLAENGFKVNAPCGGRGICGKCEVQEVLNPAFATRPIYTCKTHIDRDMTIILSESEGRGLDTFNSFYQEGEKKGLGVALDIGTTTVVGCLVDLKSGQILDRTSALNPQSAFGADVITRISASRENLSSLQKVIIDKTNEIIKVLAKRKKIDELVISANTTMLHIFLGVNPEPIGVAPFTPIFTETVHTYGAKLNVLADKVTLLPSVSGYIGSDITAGLLACEIPQNQTSLFVDIGTNGEIALLTNGKIFATSSAAGPALEGACIECGMGGVDGAIDSVTTDGREISFTTVGSKNAVGICGSGLVDIIAVLVKEGIIDESGAFDEECESLISNRLVSDRFYISDTVYISQKDIRQFQLAKSAICSAIKTIVSENNLTLSQIDTVYIAGGLGYYTNMQNAGSVGLIPNELVTKCKTVGNTALLGAIKCMLSNKNLEKVKEIASKTEAVELASSPVFAEEFIENMAF